MKRFAIASFAVVALGTSMFVGCREEVSHTSKDEPRLLGNGRVKEESTTYKNPDGSYSTEKSRVKTGN